MARKSKDDKSKEIAVEELQSMKKMAEIGEAYLVGLLWSDPISNSGYFEKITHKDFLHKAWAFNYEVARQLFESGVRNFDEISIRVFLEEKNIEEKFEEYGGFDVIDELVELVKENESNIELYYTKLIRNRLIVNLYKLYGEQVFVDTEKYSYKELSTDELSAYWQAKSSMVNLSVGRNYTTETLYTDGESFIRALDDRNDELLPFYKSNYIGNVVQGIPRGEVTIIGGFGNSGKSSFLVDKVLMSMLTSDEKTLIVLNEESAISFQIRLVLSIINHEMEDKPRGFSRKKLLNTSALTDDDKKLIGQAWQRVYEIMDGDSQKIQVVYMEQYKINELKDIARFYAMQGYINLIIDTHKVPDQYSSSSRWEAFVEATKEIYKFTRAEAGGLNLRTVLSIQLADNHIGDRFLSFDAIGEGKAMKNEASTVLMFRPLFADEYEKLKPYRFVSGLNGKGKWTKEDVELDKEKTYYVMFIPKNRQGANTDTGQDCILMQPNFDFNSFTEIGYVKINRMF